MEKQLTQEQKDEKLLTTTISSKTEALEVMIGFLASAQRKGIFSLREAGKIMECITKLNDSSSLPSTSQPVENGSQDM